MKVTSDDGLRMKVISDMDNDADIVTLNKE
jgi:hypothetical protein